MQVSVDYLSASVPAENLERLVEAMTCHLGEITGEKKTGRWSNIAQWGGSAAVMFHHEVRPDAYGREHGAFKYDRVFFDLKGQALASMGWAGLCGFLDSMNVPGWKFTRFDLAVDVFDLSMTVRDIADKHPASHVTPYRARRVLLHDGASSGGGVYYGSKEGGRELVVYDKGAQTNADRRWLRFESRLYGAQDRASDAFRYVFGGPPWPEEFGGLCRDETALARRAAEIVGGSIDFVDDRGDRVAWWSAILQELGSVTLKPPDRTRKTVEDVKRHYEKVLPKSFAKIFRSMEKKSPGSFDRWCLSLVNAGRDRLGWTDQDDDDSSETIATEDIPF
jgi:hypothetical protein